MLIYAVACAKCMVWEVYGGKMDAATHLALDEVVFERAKHGHYTLLLPDYDRPMLVLAHDQHPADRIGTVAYTRSFTPGGAMLCDRNVFPFSIAVPRESGCEDYRKDAKATHLHFCSIIQRALADLGVHDSVLGEQFYLKVKREPRNLPLAGTSQRMESTAQLYHGVITLDAWDAEQLGGMVALRSRNGRSERELIMQLPYVRAYNPRPLDELKATLQARLARDIAGTDSIANIPEALNEEAAEVVRSVYAADAWLRYAQHSLNERLSLSLPMQKGLGFCLLGSEFQ